MRHIEYLRKPLKYTNYAKHKINVPMFIEDINLGSGVIQSGFELKRFAKSFMPPLLYRACRRVYQLFIYRAYRRVYQLFIDGFIENQIALWIRRYCKTSCANILEVGIGDGKLVKYVRPSQLYTGFDLNIPPSLIAKYSNNENIRFFIGNAVDIPLPNSSIDFVWSTEVFEHIKDFDDAIREVYRVCKNGAILLISIPNNFCFKYKVKGPHHDHVNNWTYAEFVELVSPWFQVIEGTMEGYWLPYFKNSRYSIQLAFSHSDEYFNTNFFFVLKCKK